MTEPALNIVMNDVISTLSGYLSPAIAPIPSSSISFLSVAKKNPAIGNRISTDFRAGYPVAAIKAGHLDANVQLQIWDADPESIEVEMNDLQGRILADKELLRGQGFIKLKSQGSATSEHVGSLNAWRKTTQFNLLYEFQYQDSDDALSIIHRIPVTNDLENEGTADQELSTVTDTIQRWDDDEAWSLNVIANSSNTINISEINVLAHLPALWVGNQVILERRNLDNPLAPSIYPSLNDFLNAVSGDNPTDINARISFTSLIDFLGSLNALGSSFELGDWDEDAVLDQYQAYNQIFEKPIVLTQKNDTFRISYQAAPFDSKAVVYLRAKVT